MSTAWGERLEMLHESRKRLYSLPTDVLFELPGRPNVLYAIKDYRADKTAGAAECRSDMPFLFKAFETGQIGPRRLSRMVGENKPRNATIHEYLDWTVTGVEAKNEGEYVSSARARLADWACCCGGWLGSNCVEVGGRGVQCGWPFAWWQRWHPATHLPGMACAPGSACST
jgi:hypothetical protein